jgi:hypothetical protein
VEHSEKQEPGKPRIHVRSGETEPQDKAGSSARPPEPGSPWAHFFARLGLVLLRPTKAWERLSKEQLTLGEVLWPHVVVLILARGIAELIGNLLSGKSLGLSFGELAVAVVSWFVLVWVVAIASGSVASTRGGARLAANDAFSFGAYGLTPLFVVGVLSVIPLPYVSQAAGVLAMPYAFYVLSVGVVPMLRVKESESAAIAGLVCGTLLLAWALLPTLLALVLRAIGSA